MKIIIAGGGTGGHVYPGVAVYKALKRIEGEVDALFIGAKEGVEAKIFSDLHLPYKLLPVRGLRARSFASKLRSLMLMARAVAGAIKEVNAFQPDIVIGTGGYASVAVIIASVILRKLRVLQEQNSVPGIANRILSRFSHLVLLSFAGSEVYLPRRSRKVIVGNPIRFKKPASLDRKRACEKLGLEADIPTVLLMGGSRGAMSLNLSIAGAIPKVLAGAKAQFVVLTGERDYIEMVQKLGANSQVRLFPYIEEMEDVYSAADIAVSRSGASSVFELAAWGIPTIFVPYPYAADDHQAKNLEPLLASNAVVLLKDEDISGEKIAGLITSLLRDKKRQGEMGEKMTRWAKTDADTIAANEIIELIKKTRKGN